MRQALDSRTGTERLMMSSPPHHDRDEPGYLETGQQEEPQPAHPDASLWMIWMGLVLVSVAVLPFLVRHTEWARAIADACLSLVRG